MQIQASNYYLVPQVDDMSICNNWSERDYFQHWIKTEDVRSMLIYEFQLEAHEYPTASQVEFVRRILFGYSRRMLLNWFTRAGKSHACGWLIGLYILLNENKTIKIIGPQVSQTHVIRNAFTKAMAKSRNLKNLLQINISRQEAFNSETSKQRMTFRNGCELSILGVQGEGKGAMGQGGDLNIVDELSLIEPATYRTKVDRMLGDNVHSSILIGLFNPWSQSTIAYDLYISGRFDIMQVGWKQGISEGRLTKEYVEEKEELLDPVEFQVLFESKFPKDSIDTLFTPEQIQEAQRRKVSPTIGKIGIGCDVARFGTDKTTIAVRSGNCCWYLKKYQKEDTRTTSNRIGILIKKYLDLGYEINVAIDDTGVGGGVVDNLRAEWEQFGVTIVDVKNGGVANNSKSYADRATELWFWLADNIKNLQLPRDSAIAKQFSQRRYSYQPFVDKDNKGRHRTTESNQESNKSLRRKLEPKDNMKKRGIRSPDEAEAVAYAFEEETGTSFEYNNSTSIYTY